MTNEQAYHHTLRWVNELRAREFDLPPLDDLRPGARKSPFACAVAESLDRRAAVNGGSVVVRGRSIAEAAVLPVPAQAREFMVRFDLGLYPGLLSANRREVVTEAEREWGLVAA